MKKRTLSLLLALVMVLALLPVSALADGVFTSVSLKLDRIEPIHEEYVNTDMVKMTASELTFLNKPTWHRVSSSSKLTENADTFSRLDDYYLEITVKSSKSGWYLNPSTKINVDAPGSYKVENKGYEGGGGYANAITLYIYYHCVDHYGDERMHYPYLRISDYFLYNTMTPGDIKLAAASQKWGTMSCWAYGISNVKFYRKGSSTPMAATDKFQRGQTYQIKFDVTVPNDYRRQHIVFDDDIIPTVNVTENEMGDYTTVTSHSSYSASCYFEFPFVVKEKLTTGSIAGIEEPKVGQAPQTSGFTSSDSRTTVSLVQWQDSDGKKFSGNFESGKTYYLWLKISPKNIDEYEMNITDKNKVTANRGEVVTVQNYWDGFETDPNVRIKFTMPGSIVGKDKGAYTYDLTGGPMEFTDPDNVVAGLISIGAIKDLGGGNYDLNDDGTADYSIFTESGKQYIGALTDATVSGGVTLACDEDYQNYMKSVGKDYYSSVVFNMPVKTLPTYTITFNAAGGTVSSATATTGTNGRLSELPTPTKSGGVFQGWFTSADAGEQVTTETVFKNDATVYAHWNTTGGVVTGVAVDLTHGDVVWSLDQYEPLKNTLDALEAAGSLYCTVAGGTYFYDLDKDFINDLEVTPDSYNAHFAAMPNYTVHGYKGFSLNADAYAYLNGISCTSYADSVVFRFPATNPFTDVTEGDYFYDAVIWAYYHNPQITTGTSSTTYEPDATVLRGQAVTFLWRAAGCPTPVGYGEKFTDVDYSDSSWYGDAVQWAVENGITNGVGGGKFAPWEPLYRDQMLTFIWRTLGKPNDKGTIDPWYADAENWATLEGILEGTIPAYAHDAYCPRADVVYYLFKAMEVPRTPKG